MFLRDTRQRHRQREKLAPWREPDMGLDLRTPGSRPEPEADTQLQSHPGAPRRDFRSSNSHSSFTGRETEA